MFKKILGVWAVCQMGISYSHEFSDSEYRRQFTSVIGHGDDVVSGVSPRGTGGSLSHRTASVGVGVPKEDHEEVLLERNGLRETLGKTHSALDATQAHVQVLESGHTRMETQLDLLIRMQQPVARPACAAQTPPSLRGTDPDLKQTHLKHGMCAQFACKIERIRKFRLSNDREWSSEARTQLCL